MIAKVLKKLGLGHSAYRLAAPFYSAKYKGAAGEKPEEAMALLQTVSPDRGASCCIPPRPAVEEHGADLDIILPAYNVENTSAAALKRKKLCKPFCDAERFT